MITTGSLIDWGANQEIKFSIEVGEGAFDEVIAYNELSNLIEKRNLEEAEDRSPKGWAFQQITRNVGLLSPSHYRC